MKKCSFPAGITLCPDGVHELDPCDYEEIEALKNVTVQILRCRKCGRISVGWERQENTEKVERV